MRLQGLQFEIAGLSPGARDSRSSARPAGHRHWRRQARP